MPPKKKDPTFAEARARLDAILEELEADDGDVDQLAARVREAAELLRVCRDRLSSARQEVTRVVAEMEASTEVPAPDIVTGGGAAEGRPAKGAKSSRPAAAPVEEEPPPDEGFIGPDDLPF